MSPLDHTPIEIPLTQGQVAVVCRHDLATLANHTWHAHKMTSNQKYYAGTNLWIDKKVKGLMMHVLVNRTPKGFDTDHINRDTLDNRCVNLCTATRTENLRNRAVQKNSTSGVRGVFYHSRDKCWTASIRVNRKLIWLGKFKTKDEAVVARLAADLNYGFTEPL